MRGARYALVSCAGIIRHIIEDYHEKLEEDFLFPRFEKARKLAELTAILRRQHQVGRMLTDEILALAKAPQCRPHEARDDPPQLQSHVSAARCS
jgi:hypothetical protein